MKLHMDPKAFETLLLDVSEQSKIRADIIEKDYYVTLLLKELAQKQSGLPAFFKGGTALYKALGSIRRFSEDIDLTVSINECSNSQAKRRLERAANEYESLRRDKEDKDNDNRKGSITSIYRYESVVTIDAGDALQRFGRVKVEATSFTVSEPFEPMWIAPIIFDRATSKQQEILMDTYEVKPFLIETILLERIFIDKVFATEFYYLREDYFDVAKHLYDIAVLLKNDKVMSMRLDDEMLKRMIDYKRKEEQMRVGSELDRKSIGEFSFLKTGYNDANLMKEFLRMQAIYVFQEEHILSLEVLKQSISEIPDYFKHY
jgi:predicted nucleotidyltransferase component of viral defense system